MKRERNVLYCDFWFFCTVQIFLLTYLTAYSALMLLVGWQEGHPACKNWVLGCWHSYLSGARWTCIWPFLVSADLGSPGQRAVKRSCYLRLQVIRCSIRRMQRTVIVTGCGMMFPAIDSRPQFVTFLRKRCTTSKRRRETTLDMDLCLQLSSSGRPAVRTVCVHVVLCVVKAALSILFLFLFFLHCCCIPKPHNLLLPDWFDLSGTGLLMLSWKSSR